MNERGNFSNKLTGWQRLVKALGYSVSGLRAGWGESAFRLEAVLSAVLLPLAFWLGRSWLERAALVAVVFVVLVVELLNTAIECAFDQQGTAFNAYTQRGKDMASAAVLLSLLLCGGVWLAAAWARFA